MKIDNSKKKGFVLISALFFSLIFLVIIIPIISWSVNEYSWTSRSFMALKALNLADAGAELAIWDIMHNNAQFMGWSGSNPKTLTINDFIDNSGDAAGSISIKATNTSPGNYLVESTGFVPSIDNTIVKKTVKVKVFPHALFNNGLFGYSTVNLAGNTIVDSYNSDLGPYSLLTAGSNGDIGSNGILNFTENSIVNGDIFIGPSGSLSPTTPSHVKGDTVYSGKEVEIDPVEVPNYLISASSQGNYSLAGQNEVIIPSGDYRYESISISAKAILTISSNTRMYVHNDFYISGQSKVVTNDGVEIYIGGAGNFAGQGIVNTSGLASNLRIYGVNPTSSLSYTGQSDFYGTLYAPQSTIYMAGDASFYGAAVGDNITLGGNIQFHYDEALADNGPFSGYDVAYWQEN